MKDTIVESFLMNILFLTWELTVYLYFYYTKLYKTSIRQPSSSKNKYTELILVKNDNRDGDA